MNERNDPTETAGEESRSPVAEILEPAASPGSGENGPRRGQGVPRPRHHRAGRRAHLPAAVETDEDGIKRVHYYGLIGPLIEAVRELDARMRTLEERLDATDRT